MAAVISALLIHGHQSSSASWWRVAKELRAQGWRVITPDLPGHGQGPRLPLSRASVDALVDALVGSLQPSPAHRFDVVVGHSLGAVIGLQLAARGIVVPEVLVLEEPPVPLNSEERQLKVRDLRARVAQARAGDPGEAVRLQLSLHPRWEWRDAQVVIGNRRLLDLDFCEELVRCADWDLAELASRCPAPIDLILARGSRPEPEPPPQLGAVKPRRFARMGSEHNVHRSQPSEWCDFVRAAAS